MAELSISNFEGINTFTNPFNTKDGNIIHCVNLDAFPAGAKTKRPGYTSFLSNADTAQVNSLFSWTKNDGATQFLYRASGSVLYSSQQGTGAWTPCVNGTISSGGHVGYAVSQNTLFVGDGVGSTRHTTDGTTFTNTTLAPVAASFVDYQGRIYAGGTGSYLFYSNSGTPTDWSPSDDSSSVEIPGPGKMGRIFKASDRVLATKTSRYMHRWDGDSLVDMATKLGPSSPYSVGEKEDFKFWINSLGLYACNGGKPQLISNPVQRQFYNGANTGLSGTQSLVAPGETFQYDYYVSMGTVTDDFTGIQMGNSILRYDYIHDHFDNCIFANFPTAYHSYTDINGVDQFIFGDASGQVYAYGGTALTDNGTPIESSLIFLVHANLPHVKKDFGYIEFYTNPGCQASVQFMTVDTVPTIGGFQGSGLSRWRELGSLSGGYTQFRFPPDTRGKLLYIKVYDSGSNNPFSFYSVNYTFEPISLR